MLNPSLLMLCIRTLAMSEDSTAPMSKPPVIHESIHGQTACIIVCLSSEAVSFCHFQHCVHAWGHAYMLIKDRPQLHAVLVPS